MQTAVIVAAFDTNVTDLPATAVGLRLENGQNGTVSEVQPFPGQANVFLIEVRNLHASSIYVCLETQCG